MDGNESARKLFWRWRSNPLRRHDDIVEAWLVLALWAVVAVGGTAAGLVTAHAADETFAQQRAERHSVQAVLLTDAPKRASSVRSSSDQVLADVRWTALDGSVRTDRTPVDTGMRAGSHVVLWQDDQGSLATQPPSPAEAAVEAGVLGTFAGLALAGGVYALGAVARWRLELRRIEGWGREWDLAGPQWGHRTT
ncbi:hypothetical protein M2158_000458 [Streptomyces sp. SAI-144]|uniref:Rv1733c family protein n=1 Tax=unclassified Streptomyces TaxID=2593676 RepID=UPI002476E567|nr:MULTISPECIES: hypothetical protein [unclassified Streptomyces]MDH6431981.1 hypothetical protein [Streptomyces sp. SAI-144]MDH6492663.1 hypothetical protein [Streptomyces sp. SAI-127]